MRIFLSTMAVSRGYWDPLVGADENSVPEWISASQTIMRFNWFAATAGSGTSATVGNAPDSICPHGWRIPTGGPDAEFVQLSVAYGGPTYTVPDVSSEIIKAFTGNPLNFGRNGYSADSYYFSSTGGSSIGAYNFDMYSQNFNPGYNMNSKSDYFNVRCVKSF